MLPGKREHPRGIPFARFLRSVAAPYILLLLRLCLSRNCQATLKAGGVIPGFGHAVLRVTDPRFAAACAVVTGGGGLTASSFAFAYCCCCCCTSTGLSSFLWLLDSWFFFHCIFRFFYLQVHPTARICSETHSARPPVPVRLLPSSSCCRSCNTYS